ncbi:MAG: Hsp20/alpha crystallin family protein [Gemmatimonas sp.]|jgi:HSP20 family protein|uniref:Hsp20/alpha crystallin family protein n=1 Tax=Gemmatimonas sp. TaxID=1962908 RepID=UPI00391F8F06|nr:Hsp20/alpha crystallin family protein [Gemmatimonadota bacterium]
MTLYTFPLTAPRLTSSARRDLDRLLGETFSAQPASAWQPPVDAREDATGYTIDIDLPGVTPDSLEVLAEDGVLTIRGARPAREAATNEQVLFTERAQGPFARRFRLPKAADLQSVSATFTDGVLQVRIAKIAPAQPRRVPVTSARSQTEQTAAPAAPAATTPTATAPTATAPTAC